MNTVRKPSTEGRRAAARHGLGGLGKTHYEGAKSSSAPATAHGSDCVLRHKTQLELWPSERGQGVADDEKRSSAHGIDRAGQATGPARAGVGARQGQEPPQPWGGGYQNVCTGQKFGADARIDVLRAMKLPALWMRVAESVGVDAFLAMWRAIDADPALSRDTGMIELTIRPYRSFLYAQRNRYIEALGERNLPARTIQTMLEENFGERLTVKHIKRILRAR